MSNIIDVSGLLKVSPVKVPDVSGILCTFRVKRCTLYSLFVTNKYKKRFNVSEVSLIGYLK